MDFSLKLPKMTQDKVLFLLSLVALISLFAFINRSLEREPDRDTRMIGMATLKGTGNLPLLHDAMNRDGLLTEMVGALSSRPSTDMFLKRVEVDLAVADILFRWAGSDLIPNESFGPFIDARVAGFLQTAGIIPPETVRGTVIRAEEAGMLNEAWFRAFDYFRLRLLGQTLGKKVYHGGLTYDVASDSLSIPGHLNEQFIASLDDALQSSKNSGESIHNFLDFIVQTKGFNNLSEQEQDLIMGMKVRPKKPDAVADPAASAPGSIAVPLEGQAGAALLPPVAPSSGP